MSTPNQALKATPWHMLRERAYSGSPRGTDSKSNRLLTIGSSDRGAAPSMDQGVGR